MWKYFGYTKKVSTIILFILRSSEYNKIQDQESSFWSMSELGYAGYMYVLFVFYSVWTSEEAA